MRPEGPLAKVSFGPEGDGYQAQIGVHSPGYEPFRRETLPGAPG